MCFLEYHAVLTTLDRFATRLMTYLKLIAVMIKHVAGVTNVVSQEQCRITGEIIVKYTNIEGLDGGIDDSSQTF